MKTPIGNGLIVMESIETVIVLNYKVCIFLHDSGRTEMTETKPSMHIQNIVASASINQTINLNLIVEKFPHVEYRPKVFPGLVFRLKKPKTATLIFGTGKMVCTGAKSEEAARKAVNKVARELKKHGIISVANKPVVHIQNIVASGELGGEIDLESVVYKLRRVMYEPEQFPGAVYRMDDPRVVFLIFSAGKLVCVGAKKEQEVYDAVNKLQKILEENEVIFYPQKN
jgi:transcription initiation factor TFIID TATA-box-binding protein